MSKWNNQLTINKIVIQHTVGQDIVWLHTDIGRFRTDIDADTGEQWVIKNFHKDADKILSRLHYSS